MKVILVNGSPNEKNCTYTALKEVEKSLIEEGIDTQIFWIGKKPIAGCLDCHGCKNSGRCVIDDCVNEFTELAKGADGFVFGTPVHFASGSGGMTSFMDRAFYSGRRKNDPFAFKPAACIAVARRAGTLTAFDQLMKYPTISQMPVVSSHYWNIAYGLTPEEIRQDKEGMQIMRALGRNMAWLLKCKEAAAKAGISAPAAEQREITNFIR